MQCFTQGLRAGYAVVVFLILAFAFVVGLVLTVSGSDSRSSKPADGGGVNRPSPPPTDRYQSYTPKPATAPPRRSAYTASRSELVKPRETANWVKPGETVTIADFEISGGMIYVGDYLPARYGEIDNALINPKLPVAQARADRAGETMSYWPSYSAITMSARRAYLEWLATGRSNPEFQIGYVFLFFYGLERRFFVDKAFDEVEALAAEVERLLSIYGDNGSFRGYARRFLDAADLLCGRAKECLPSLDLRDGYEIPFFVRRHLGLKLIEGEALGSEDALIWVLALPDNFPRTPVTRCFEEFKALWALRFDRHYPEGLKVQAPEATVEAVYRPASACFNATISVDKLPDIAAVHAPAARLRTLMGSCSDELDSYSRFVGRNPEARETLEASLLLPGDLAEGLPGGEAVKAVEAKLQSMLGTEDCSPASVSELMGVFALSSSEGDRLTPAVGRQLGQVLDRFNIGFEPDKRYGAISPAVEGQVVLFRAAGGGGVDPDDPIHAAARTMVEVAVLAAQADGVVVPEEVEAINDDLKSIAGLSSHGRARLLALAMALLNDPPKQQAALSRLLKLPATQRRRTTEAAISAVLADGRVTPGEVKFLEKLHKALGLPQEDVYASLHRGSVRSDEPVPVSPAAPVAGIPIPAEPPPEKVVVALDPGRLDRVRQETAEVSKLLAGIFVDEAAPERSTAGKPVPAPARSAFAGLDGAHADLLDMVLAQNGCDRTSFDAKARELKLFPDGALETINDWAFDTLDEPVLEGDDVITAAEHLRERLETLRAAN